MIKMINKVTGTEMYVDDSRVGEYEAMGHRRANRIPVMAEISRPGEIERAMEKAKAKAAAKAPAKPAKKPATKKKV